MKLHILSDLHLEFGSFTPLSTDADVVVLAGDISTGTKGVDWAAQTFPDVPVLYVAGNHEYYGHAMPRLVGKLRQRAEGTSVHVLENDSVLLGGIAFHGCTLWTDFDLFGNPPLASRSAGTHMNDYRKIRIQPKYSRLRPLDTLLRHKQSLAWLRTALSDHSRNTTVVITHHAPSLLSVAPARRDTGLSAAYASALDDFVETSRAALWVYGHTHYAADYRIGSTRMLSNPRGYSDEPVEGFRPGLLAEV